MYAPPWHTQASMKYPRSSSTVIFTIDQSIVTLFFSLVALTLAGGPYSTLGPGSFGSVNLISAISPVTSTTEGATQQK